MWPCLQISVRENESFTNDLPIATLYECFALNSENKDFSFSLCSLQSVSVTDLKYSASPVFARIVNFEKSKGLCSKILVWNLLF